MLRKIRITLAVACLAVVTGLFLDFTGTLHLWFGWLAKVQLVPAVMAVNLGVVGGVVALTLLCGRLYCSVLCPLGVMQDAVSRVARGGKKRRFAFSYSPAKHWLRYATLAVFALALGMGVALVVAVLEPYSAYGRVASNLLSPFYQGGNNALAYLSEHLGRYTFYPVEVWWKGGISFLLAVVTLGVVGVLAWRNGRTYCNTVCPVGTVLGFVSRFAWFKVSIDTDKCNRCGLCARRCKASCIDSKAHTVDYSRCVACMSCIDVCKQKAIRYAPYPVVRRPNEAPPQVVGEADASRRHFFSVAALFLLSATLKAQERREGDGGLAEIKDKKSPRRTTPIVPPGAASLRNFADRCTACQLCVSACPSHVLHPSTEVAKFMQPEMSFERGYCRPECVKCSEVCPAKAIIPITLAAKSATQIGHAVWIKANCLVLRDDITCTSCERHCPTGAIRLVPQPNAKPKSPKIPVVDTERCIGCGACESLCPARPLSAIYVEGNEVHKRV